MSTRTIEDWAAALEGQPPEQILEWAAERFGPSIVFATAFGPEGMVLLDIIGRRRLGVDVVTLDTGLLFDETRALWREVEARYNVTIRGIEPALTLREQAQRFGSELWTRDPDRCCAMRKVEPLRQELRGRAAWISSIRRDQTPERARARTVDWDRTFGLVKVNPLVRWTSADVWSYLRAHDVPYNELHDRGIPSVGCWPCTSAVAAGEDARAGRWRGLEKRECGLHIAPSPVAVQA